MKKQLTLLLSGIMALTCVGSTKVTRPKIVIDPLDVSVVADVSESVRTMKKGATPLARKHKKIRSMSPAADPMAYTGLFQSFYENWEFNFDGGQFLHYDVAISIDGAVATISNLFNLEDGYPYDYSVQQDITGVYDAQDNTITVATPVEFDMATVAGYIYNFYPAVVMSGIVGEDQSLAPSDKLVFQLSEDMSTITTDQNFGVAMYNTDGTSMGFKCMYKGCVISSRDADKGIVIFTDSVDFGQGYMGGELTRSVKAFNFSASESEYSVSCEGESFAVSPSAGVAGSMEELDFQITFSPSQKGTSKGGMTVTAGDSASSISFTGVGIDAPDFSSIVKEGDITLSTSITDPFVLIENDGRTVARSKNEIKDGSCSYLEATFEVGEGEIGEFSWKGRSWSEIGYAAVPEIITDDYDVENFCSLIGADISGVRKFGPGRHSVKFSYSMPYASSATENDYMYVYDLSFTAGKAQASSATLLTPVVEIGSCILDGGNVEKYGEIIIKNEGTDPLSVVSVTEDSHFIAEIPDMEAGFLEDMIIPVKFMSDKSGEYAASLSIQTSAGEFVVECKALVRDMPDFGSIVKSGEFSFTTNEVYPFLVADGKAYNSTSKVPDTERVTSSFTAGFNVPEGKLGVINWKGHLSCSDIDENGMWRDYLGISVYNGVGSFNTIVWGEQDLDTNFYPYVESPDGSELVCLPGYCEVKFSYVQNGDNEYGGEDLVEIYDLSLELIDNIPNNAVLDRESVEFQSVYEGKTSKATVRITNLGSSPLEIEGFDSDGAFDGVVPGYEIAFNQSADIVLTFTPDHAGLHEDTLLMLTTGGDFEIKCSGYAESTAGLLLLEDFEDDAAGWTLFDRDSDGDCWNLAYNVYGGFTEGHVHSGEECIVSFSWDYLSGSFRPDNWTFSPEFTVPAEGAVLTWWAAGDDISRSGDRYSVYVAEGERPDAFNMESYGEVWTEIIDFDDWRQRTVDLSAYAGKTVHLAFRHHDSEGFYLVKIDDVFVHTGTVGVSQIAGERVVESVDYFTPEGMKTSASARGVLIEKTAFSDGSVVSRKILRE